MVRDLNLEVKFRRALPGEIPLLADLATASWKSAIHTNMQEANFDNRLFAYFLDFCINNSENIIVAEWQDRCVGWGAYVDSSDYISDLWIAPDYQGKKIGSALLQCLIKIIILNGNETVKIGTYACNDRAVSFYKKMGFKVYQTELEYSPIMKQKIAKVRLVLQL